MTAKTDNHDLRAKLELRRYFLRKFHADDPPDVLDCCQGGGLLWKQLRKEFMTRSYWGVDLKPKRGRVKLDSVRILQQPGWPQNVVDIDTYGSPWKHWAAMLPNAKGPITVFLTVGQRITGTVGKVSKGAIEALGLKGMYANLPAGFHPKLAGHVLRYCLAMGCDYGIMLIEVLEAETDNRNVRYIGVRLGPANDNARLEPGASEPEQVGKEPAHV